MFQVAETAPKINDEFAAERHRAARAYLSVGTTLQERRFEGIAYGFKPGPGKTVDFWFPVLEARVCRGHDRLAGFADGIAARALCFVKRLVGSLQPALVGLSRREVQPLPRKL